MKQCKEIAEIEYKAYIEELGKGKKVAQAIEDAWKKGAPKVFMPYECLRRHIAHRHKHGKYEYGSKNKHLTDFLDEMYKWWLANNSNNRYKYLCLNDRMEQPAPWAISLETFRTHIYRYARTRYKEAPKFF